MPDRRLPFKPLTAALCAGLALGLSAPAALASGNQVAMFQEDMGVSSDPAGTLSTLRDLGVGVLRYTVNWSHIAPSAASPREPTGFDATATDSTLYDWSVLDQVVTDATREGITVDLSLTGAAPIWAVGSGAPADGPAGAWRPDPRKFGEFVTAVANRYSGHFRPTPQSAPLPRVRMWEIWNEPNFGPDLAPQATHGSRVATAAPMYRALVDAAGRSLKSAGHGRDTIIIGNLDARGQSGRPHRGAPDGLPGNFAATKPLRFVRQLYCVDGRLRPLRGRAARLIGCPTTRAGSRHFRSAHPLLFTASGFGDHPYPLTTPPDRADSRDPDFAEFTELPLLTRMLDGIQRAYGSRHRFAIYNNEYGYITDPPNHSQRFPSPARAADYMNWAEYLSWRNPRIASTMQFLLTDPNPLHAPEYGGFASGLQFYGGRHKPGYDAYRLPVYLPETTVRRGARVLVWGCIRPAHAYGNRRVLVQFEAGRRGAWRTVASLRVRSARGYFETRLRLPASGKVRLSWTYPGGTAVHSRTVSVRIR